MVLRWLVSTIILSVAAPAFAASAVFTTKDSVLELLNDVRVVPVAIETAHGREENPSGAALNLRATTALIVKDSYTGNGQTAVRLQRDVQGYGVNDFWVLASSLNESDFRVAVPSIADQLNVNDPGDEESAASDVYVMTNEGRFQSRSVNTYCALHPIVSFCSSSAVKYEIEKMGLAGHRLQGTTSHQLMTNLAAEGWSEVGCGARAKPSPGMTCSYDGQFMGVGFVEIWTGRGWYSGHRFKLKPLNRQCSSCKIKR